MAAVTEEFLEPLVASMFEANSELRRICQEALLVFLKDPKIRDHAKGLKIAEVLEARSVQVNEEIDNAEEDGAAVLQEESARLNRIKQLL